MFKVGDRVVNSLGNATIMQVRHNGSVKVKWDSGNPECDRSGGAWWYPGGFTLIEPEIDLTKIEKPLGLLEPEVRKALQDCGERRKIFVFFFLRNVLRQRGYFQKLESVKWDRLLFR